MQSRHRQFRDSQYSGLTEAQMGDLAASAQSELIGPGNVQGIKDHPACGVRHGRHPLIVAIEHHGAVACEDARLGAGVLIDARVAIHVVGAHVEQRRHLRRKRVGGLELKARQLQNIHLRMLTLEKTKRRESQYSRRPSHACHRGSAYRRPWS